MPKGLVVLAVMASVVLTSVPATASEPDYLNAHGTAELGCSSVSDPRFPPGHIILSGTLTYLGSDPASLYAAADNFNPYTQERQQMVPGSPVEGDEWGQPVDINGATWFLDLTAFGFTNEVASGAVVEFSWEIPTDDLTTTISVPFTGLSLDQYLACIASVPADMTGEIDGTASVDCEGLVKYEVSVSEFRPDYADRLDIYVGDYYGVRSDIDEAFLTGYTLGSPELVHTVNFLWLDPDGRVIDRDQYETTIPLCVAARYRVTVNTPSYRNTFTMVWPYGTVETETKARIAVNRGCTKFRVSFVTKDGVQLRYLEAKAYPRWSVMTVQVLTDGVWRFKASAVARTPRNCR